MISTAELTSPASANTPLIGVRDHDYTLEHKYTRTDGRIYLSGVNLLTVSRLMRDYDIDPEILSGHPALKSYNLGLTVTF